MQGWKTTAPCPECGHGTEHGELNSVLVFYRDEEGYNIGERYHCLRCEHSWDDIRYGD